MRKLTNSQRQAIKKLVCLLFSVFLFLGSIAAVPRIVSILPDFRASAARNILRGTEAAAQTVPVFALGSGNVLDLGPDQGADSDLTDTSDKQPEVSDDPTEEPVDPVPGEDDLLVTPNNLCWYELGEEPALNIINRTSYEVELDDFIQRDFPVDCQITDDPLVLIIHTHGSERYLPSGYDFYPFDDDFRSKTVSETVVHIGDILCEKLNSFGIPTIHDATMHDIPDYNQSYNNSLDALETILAENPTIQFVIDLHRDSVFDSDGNNIKPFATIEGSDCAQLMIVVGTDEMGIAHPDWRQNLTFATYLQQKVNDFYPTLMRPVNLRTAEFNQAVTKGSIILEVGSCGNTVEEAENAISFFAEAYAALLKEQLAN